MSTSKAKRLQAVRDELGDCRRCNLCATRNTIVFGEGDPAARLLFIGEGPGREEDRQGRPFVGRSGTLLTEMIRKGMRIDRGEVYICNIVKCRPTVDQLMTRDRPPQPEEIAACSPFLLKQIEAIAPEVIVTLGSPSTKFMLGVTTGITALRGKWHTYKGIPLMPTVHPSYVLRNGGDSSPMMRVVLHDIKLVLARLNS